MTDFDDFLRFDPLAEAEKVTGKSYKDDKLTEAVGLLLMIDHGKQKEEELALRGDSYYGIKFVDFVNLAHAHGFEDVLVRPFKGEWGHDQETHIIMWNNGILLVCESFGDSLNTVKIYFNLEVSKENRDELWKLPMSGKLDSKCLDNDRYVWVGDIDVREGFVHYLERLGSIGTFLNPWIDKPFLWFVDYTVKNLEYGDGPGSFHEANQRIFEQLPEEIRNQISAK